MLCSRHTGRDKLSSDSLCTPESGAARTEPESLALCLVQGVLFQEQRAVMEMDYLVMHRVLDPLQARFLVHSL